MDDADVAGRARGPQPVASILGPLARALRATPFEGVALRPLTDSGLAHHHVRLGDDPVLARIPKQSQMGLRAQDNLRYQAACFERASTSGSAPRLVGTLEPTADLPRGALLVEYIEGRQATLPDDLPAIVAALARLHALPLLKHGHRPPLADPPDPVAALDDEIRAQARHLDAADVHPTTREIIDAERERLGALSTRADRPHRTLISFDAHPGNFVIRPDGEAVLVDLEKCRYSYPGLDLAHATLYTSTTWEPGDTVVLSPAEVTAAGSLWAREVAAAGAAEVADDVAWHLPLRRAMWLWSMTWCAKWRALSVRAPAAGADGEDWSSAHDSDVLTAHVRDRVDHYLDPGTAERVAAGFDAPEWSALGGSTLR